MLQCIKIASNYVSQNGGLFMYLKIAKIKHSVDQKRLPVDSSKLIRKALNNINLYTRYTDVHLIYIFYSESTISIKLIKCNNTFFFK